MDIETIPANTLRTLNDYVEHGYEPGGFVTAVLENNLMEAFRRADINNRYAMFEICKFVYNEMPHICHGSPEKVAAWLEMKRKAKGEAQS